MQITSLVQWVLRTSLQGSSRVSCATWGVGEEKAGRTGAACWTGGGEASTGAACCVGTGVGEGCKSCWTGGGGDGSAVGVVGVVSKGVGFDSGAARHKRGLS